LMLLSEGKIARSVSTTTPADAHPHDAGIISRGVLMCSRSWEPGLGDRRSVAGEQMVIRTPDQRLRVFVSSTLGELAAERRAVARAVSAMRLIPVMFELGARPQPPRDVYRAYLAQSNVFVGLYWQRYGQVGPGMRVSGLEEEFELSAGLPRLLYVKA